MAITGTSYFPNVKKAIRYYAEQGLGDAAEVTRKIRAGEINIGVPPHNVEDGDTLKMIDNGTRYAVVTLV